MEKTIPIMLTLFFVFLTSTALADRGDGRADKDGYASPGKRIEQRLDAKGDRIERRFHQKADRAAAQGRYRQAYRFQSKGAQINHHLDRKGERIHRRLDHRGDDRQARHHRFQSYPRVAFAVQGRHHHDNAVRVMIRQPGLWLDWGFHH